MRLGLLLTGTAALGAVGLGSKLLVSLLSPPVRQDLKIQLQWELLIEAVLACCWLPAPALHGNQMKGESSARGWGEEALGTVALDG